MNHWLNCSKPIRISRQRFGGRLPRLRGIPPLSCASKYPRFMPQRVIPESMNA